MYRRDLLKAIAAGGALATVGCSAYASPSGWREFEITYRRGDTTYRITVENPHSLNRGVASVSLDGVAQSADVVLLSNDGLTHDVRLVIGEKTPVDELEPIASEVAQPEEAH